MHHITSKTNSTYTEHTFGLANSTEQYTYYVHLNGNGVVDTSALSQPAGSHPKQSRKVQTSQIHLSDISAQPSHG